MTVAELAEKLKQVPQEARIILWTENGYGADLTQIIFGPRGIELCDDSGFPVHDEKVIR